MPQPVEVFPGMRIFPQRYTSDGVSISFDLNDIDVLALNQYGPYTIVGGTVTVNINDLPGGVLPF